MYFLMELNSELLQIQKPCLSKTTIAANTMAVKINTTIVDANSYNSYLVSFNQIDKIISVSMNGRLIMS